MKAGQTSTRAGIQDILCPFTKLYITQGSNEWSHAGTKAIDVTNGDGTRAKYYAPFKCKAVYVVASSGQTVWKSVDKVRFADGTIDYCTFITVHDDSVDYKEGDIVEQGNPLADMGTAGNVTGIHAHIEFAKGSSWIEKMSTTFTYNGVTYPVYGLHNAVEFEEACFMDNTSILSGTANWKYLKDVSVVTTDELQAQLDDKDKTIDSLNTKISKLNSTITELNDKIDSLTELSATKDAEILELKQENVKLEDKIKLLEKNIENLQAENDALNSQISSEASAECNSSQNGETSQNDVSGATTEANTDNIIIKLFKLIFKIK